MENRILQKKGQGNWREEEKSTPSLALSSLKQEDLSGNWISSGREQGDEDGENMMIAGVGATENSAVGGILHNSEHYGEIDLHVSTSEGTSVLEESDDDLYHPEWIPLDHEDELTDLTDVRESVLSRTQGGVATCDAHTPASYLLYQSGGKHKRSGTLTSTAEKIKRQTTSMQPAAVALPPLCTPEMQVKIPLRPHSHNPGRGGGSLVWQFYILDKREQSKATCKLCGKKISRGKPGSNLGTTSLRSHMNSKHKAIWMRLLSSVENSKEYHPNVMPSNNHTVPSSPPCNPEGFSGRTEEIRRRGIVEGLSTSCPEQDSNSGITAFHQQYMAKETHEREAENYPDNGEECKLNFQIAKMLAVDMLPYQFVEGRGFRELMSTVAPHWEIPSQKYFSQKAVPQVHSLVMECIGKELGQNECRKVHISVSVWTSLQSMDHMVLRAHWVSFHEVSFPAATSSIISKWCKSSSFFRKHAALCMQSFNSREQKPSDVLCKLRGVIDTWVSPQSLHVGFVTADNDPNVVTAIHQGGMVHVPCFAHVLNTVVTQFLDNSSKLQEMLQSARKMCSHFHHSPAAQNALSTLQVNNNLPRHQLIEGEGTGWRSTLQMLKRLHEQRKAINDYIMDFRRPLKGESMTPAQWNLMNATCTVLNVMEEATLLVSRHDACLSQTVDRCKEVLIRKVIDEERRSGVANKLNCSSPESNAQPSLLDTKREDMDHCSNRDDMGTAGSLWDLLPQYGIVAKFDSQERKLQTASKMVTAYLLDSNFVEAHTDPLVFWENRRRQWPSLSLIAVEYLSCPASATCSSSYVNETGYFEQQAKLSPPNMDVLSFLKMNQHWIPDDYRLKREGDRHEYFPHSQNAEDGRVRPLVVKVEDDAELQWH
uniref:BED-type domain-containing protein n=1 Tax=Leptobrachium leishanense TaxID=445787 RepID=A0A8C5M8S6_9ANUR